MSDDIAERAAQLFVSARENAQPIADLPVELRPPSLAEAYAIQRAVSRKLGPVGGWKVAMAGSGEPTYAPTAARFVFPSGELPGGTSLEFEIAFRFGQALPPRPTPYQRSEVTAAIAAALVSFESQGSRLTDRRAVAKLTALADGANNHGIVVGEEIANWTNIDLPSLEMEAWVNGVSVGVSTPGSFTIDGFLDGLTSLANHAASTGGGLEAGQVVVTGARVGPFRVNEGDIVQAGIKGGAMVRTKIVRG